MIKLNRNSNDAMAYAIAAMGYDRVDKGGNPYVLHLCETVMHLDRMCESMGIEVDDEMRQAAILHDTAEDTPVTLNDLRRDGFSERVVMMVDALTKREGEAPVDYWMRVIAAGPAARAIKAADAKSNSRVERLNRLPTREDMASSRFYTGLSKCMQQAGYYKRDTIREMLLDNERAGRA